MKIVNLVDENGKEIKVDKTNVNQFVIRNAVELTKKSFPKNVGFIPTGKGTSLEAFTMDRFTQTVLDRYQEKGLFDENSNIPQKTKNTAFATMRATQIIYNLCMEQEIKNNIDKLFEDPEFAKTVQPEVREAAKKDVEEFIENINYTNLNKKFVDSIKGAFKENSDTRQNMTRFLDQSLRYVDEVSKNVFNEKYDYEDALFWDRKDMVIDKEKTLPIHDAVSEYVDPRTDYMIFGFLFGKDDVKPHEFLEHYRNDPNSLTEEEKNWVRNTYRKLEDNLAGKQIANHTGIDRVDLTDFKVDGVQIVSDEESRSVTDTTKLEARVIAEILSGKEVTSQPKGSEYMPVQINPAVIRKNPEGILDQIIDSIVEFFKKRFHFETEKDKVKAMNDSFVKTGTSVESQIERNRMTFDDLLDDKFKKTNTPPQKEADENVVQISHPTIGR